jgi:hypothetical protein
VRAKRTGEKRRTKRYRRSDEDVWKQSIEMFLRRAIESETDHLSHKQRPW